MDVALESHWIAWTDPYNALGIWAKVFLGIYVTLCVTVGTVLHLGMISYERYGQDPQKRSLNSQLVAFFSWVPIKTYCLTQIVTIWRTIIGPVNSHIFWIWCFFLDAQFFTLILIGFEIYGLKYLIIVVYKKMLPILDDFMARFLIVTNLIVGYFLGFVSLYSPFNHFSETRLVGLPSEWAKYSPMDLNLQFIVVISLSVFVLFVSIAIQIVKRTGVVAEKTEIHPMGMAAIHQKYNKEMFSMMIVIFMTVTMVGLAFLIGFTDEVSEESLKIIAYLQEDLAHSLLLLIIYPILVYRQNSELRQHVIDMIRDLF